MTGISIDDYDQEKNDEDMTYEEDFDIEDDYQKMQGDQS